jgi:regulator of protease activity HflC (stomatin/prohibitin superfamily)
VFLDWLPVLAPIVFFILISLRVISEYERGIVFRLGRLRPTPLGPGLHFLIFPGVVDRLVKIDLRTVTLDVPTQDVITKDSVSIRINAVIYYHVIDATKAVVTVEDYNQATALMGQTMLRSVVGQTSLVHLLSNQEQISETMQTILDRQTDPWGIKVTHVEIKHIDLPEGLQRAMARQAEAEREREREAKIIGADAELQAADKLIEAAAKMEKHPASLQLRLLQTMVEIGVEKNTTVYFPVPMELFEAMTSQWKRAGLGS